MFENIGNISSLSIIGVAIIVLSLVRYSITRDREKGFILLSAGLGLLGFSLIFHHMMDNTGTLFLIIGRISVSFAILFGLIGMYELGTGGPRTYLIANQKIHIIGSVVLKLYRHKYYYCFKAAEDINDSCEIPIMYAISREEFSNQKCPSKNSNFRTDKKGKIIQDTIK